MQNMEQQTPRRRCCECRPGAVKEAVSSGASVVVMVASRQLITRVNPCPCLPAWTLFLALSSRAGNFLGHKRDTLRTYTAAVCASRIVDLMAEDMFAPPVNRAMKVLDRSFFQKTIPASAARIFKPQDIARCRKELQISKDTLPNNRIQPIRTDPDTERAQKGSKCLILKPEIVHNGK